jgi:hypothetical protein
MDWYTRNCRIFFHMGNQLQACPLCIPSAGVFAKQDIASGELVTEYIGTRLVGRQARLEHENYLKECGLEDTYTIFVSRNCSIYGDQEATPEQGVACLINDHDCLTMGDVEDLEGAVQRYIDGVVADHNVDWYIHGDRLFAKACVDVKAGQELFTSYTTAWWLDRLRRQLLERACDHLTLKWKNGSPREVDFSLTDVERIKHEWQLIRSVEKASVGAIRWERDAYVKRNLMSFGDRLYEIEPSPDYWEDDIEYGLAGCDWCLEHQRKKHMNCK